MIIYMHQACTPRTLLQTTSVARRPHNPLCVPRSSTHSGVVRPHTVAFQSQTPIEQAQQLKLPSSGPKFQPFNPQTGVRQDLFNYRREIEVADGSLLIQPLTPSWVYPCGSLLTAAFADAMGVVPMYRTFIQHQIRQYLDRHADMPPKAVVLVALLTPKKASEADTALESSSSQADSAEPEGSNSSEPSQEASTSGREQDAILVGTVELSFTQSTRASYLTLNAPAECAYLCNMAVDAEYRRRGYGNILLDAADDIADIAGQRDIYLHLRFQDVAPASLYKQAGYVSDRADCFWVRLLGLDRRYLMKKHLSERQL